MKPEKIFCSNVIVLLSESKFESTKLVPLLLTWLVEVVLVWSPEMVILGKNSLLEIFLLCLADSKFYLSALSWRLFSIALLR